MKPEECKHISGEMHLTCGIHGGWCNMIYNSNLNGCPDFTPKTEKK